MKKLYVLFSVLVVLLQVSMAQPQERLWWLHNSAIYSVKTDGSDLRSIENPGDGLGDQVLGLTRSGNKMLYTKTGADPALGYFGVLGGNGTGDLEEDCYVCVLGTHGMTTAANGNVYVPYQSPIGPDIYGVRIYSSSLGDNYTYGRILPRTELTDEFYLTGTPQGVYGLSRGYSSHNGFIYRLNDDANGYQAIYHFTGGDNGYHPTGKLIEGTDGALFGETVNGGKNNQGIYFKVNKNGTGFVKLGNIADGKRTDLINGSYSILVSHIAAGYKPIRDSQGFIYFSTAFGIFKLNNSGVPVLKISSLSGSLVDLFDANGSSAVKVQNVVSGASNVPTSISFELNAIPGNQGYELQVSTDPDFKSNVKSYNLPYTEFPPIKLLGSTTYYVRARTGTWPYFGEVVHFTTETVIDYAQERVWGTTNSGSTIFSMKKDGTDLIIHQTDAGGFKQLSNHQVLVTASPWDGGEDYLSRIDRDGVKRLYTLDYQEAYTIGKSMIEIAPGRLVGVEFGAGAKVRGIDEFMADGSSYTHNIFRSTKDLRQDASLVHTTHGIYGLSRGDSNNKGFIYRVDDDKKGFTIVYQFQGLADGKQPAGKIFVGEDDFIYGETLRGGLLNKGIYFKVKDDGTSFTKIGDVHNGQPWVGSGGGKYSNLERLVNAGHPGFCQDSDGNYYVGISNGILKIGSDFILKKHIGGITNPDNLALVAPAILPETYVSNIEDGAEGLPLSLTLACDTFPGATEYFFEVSSRADFGTLEYSIRSPKPFAGIPDLLPSTIYYTRVRPNVWPYYGRVVSFFTQEGIFSSEDEQLMIRTVGDDGLFSDGIVYTNRNGNNAVTLSSGPYVTEGNHVLPLFNGEILYKNEEQLVKITKNGVVKLYELDWVDHRWMQESWVQGADGNVYALRYHINTKQVTGVVKVKLDGSGIEYHPFLVHQFNGYSPKLTATPFGIYAINQGTGGSPGVIFKLKDDLSGIEIIHTFSGTSKPQGELRYHHDGYFWGVTRNGGDFGGGVIYRIKPDGTGYEVLHHFAHNTGKSPVVGLLNGINGWVYGVAREGGKDNKGVLFRINEDFLTYEVIRHFADLGGQNPEHPLVMGSDWQIYGSVAGLGYFKTNLDNTYFTTIRSASSVNRVFILPQRFVPNVKVWSPFNLHEIPAGDAQFTVMAVPGAQTYYVEISESPLFIGQVNRFDATSNIVPVASLKANAVYYARVRTNLLPFYGETTSFTTGDVPALPSSERKETEASIATEAISLAYPNPSAGTFTLKNDVAAKSIIVTDANGLVVYENRAIDNTIPFQFGGDLKRGVYILKVVTDEGVTTSRLIKN